MTKFIPPTTGVQIALKTGQSVHAEMWHDDFDMFHDVWTASSDRPDVIKIMSVAGDHMSMETSNIAFVHNYPTDEDTYEKNELEDAYYDDFDDWE